MKYEVQLSYPMTVEFECDGDTLEVMKAAQEQAVSEIAEMDHYDKINFSTFQGYINLTGLEARSKSYGGELYVKGDICVYDDWFATGDIVRKEDNDFYYIGRKSC